MWLPKPVYEALPYYYAAIGVIALFAPLYVDYWYWPAIGTVLGLASLAAAAFVFSKRRDHRQR